MLMHQKVLKYSKITNFQKKGDNLNGQSKSKPK